MKRLGLLVALFAASAFGQGIPPAGPSDVSVASWFNATATSGNNAFVMTAGSRINLNNGSDWIADSSGQAFFNGGLLTTGGTFNVNGSNGRVSAITFDTGIAASFAGHPFFSFPSNASLKLVGSNNAASGPAITFNAENALTSGNAYVWYKDTATTQIAAMAFDGYFASATPVTLWSVTTQVTAGSATAGVLMSASTGLGGYAVPRAVTLTSMSWHATVASSGAGNTVITVTDGTNTCTATFACAGATGVVTVNTANGAGTGCVYAASAALTASVTTAGCATTQPTVQQINVSGKFQ